MKVLLVGLFGLVVFIGFSGITFADERSGKQESFKLKQDSFKKELIKKELIKKELIKKEWGKKEYNGNHRGAVPIPGTLPAFGAGFAGFAAWNWRRNRRK